MAHKNKNTPATSPLFCKHPAWQNAHCWYTPCPSKRLSQI